jgi:2-ketoarginine methyltransferase
MIDGSFRENLDRSLGYIRGFSASLVLQALITDGTLDAMKQAFTVEDVARRQGYRADLFAAVVKFLVIENIVQCAEAPQTYRLTDFGAWIAEQPGWLNLLVGGYHNVFAGLSDILKEGSEAAERDARLVGLGSYEISLHDAFPLAWRLVDAVNPRAKRFVDIGCGQGYFVREICSRLPDATAIGIEPSPSFADARTAVERAGLTDRIEIVNTGALEYTLPADTDFVMFAFVLQEILPLIGEREFVDYLRRTREAGFAGNVLAIEVEYDPDDLAVLRTPIGLGYYNPYYLLHPLTNQKLMPVQRWKDLFKEAGYRLVAEETVDPRVDPSGLEVGLVFTPT